MNGVGTNLDVLATAPRVLEQTRRRFRVGVTGVEAEEREKEKEAPEKEGRRNFDAAEEIKGA